MKNKVLLAVIGVVVLVGAVVALSFNGEFFQGKISKNNPITRAQLAKIVTIAMLGEDPQTADGDIIGKCYDPEFSDVPQDAWYWTYVCYLNTKGVMQGYADGTFKPNQKVTRAEAAKIYVMAYDVTLDIGMGGGPSVSPYADVSENDWYYQYVVDLVDYKIADIKGYVGAKFYPKQFLTVGRAEYWAKNLVKAIEKAKTVLNFSLSPNSSKVINNGFEQGLLTFDLYGFFDDFKVSTVDFCIEKSGLNVNTNSPSIKYSAGVVGGAQGYLNNGNKKCYKISELGTLQKGTDESYTIQANLENLKVGDSLVTTVNKVEAYSLSTGEKATFQGSFPLSNVVTKN